MKKILLLGSTGKMGTAITKIFSKDYKIIGKNSKDFDASDFDSVRKLIQDNTADIVINAVAMLGVDDCEEHADRAFFINTLYPSILAMLSLTKGFLLIHFSTDAVFGNGRNYFYTEYDIPSPVNLYGLTKMGGDTHIQATAKRYYLIRVPILFGETPKNNQFVEKMLLKEGLIKVADDIISSPTYSKDVAEMLKSIIESKLPYGLYNIANEGRASLYDLMKEIAPNKTIKRCSYKDFPHVALKNECTPLQSRKLPPLRNWKEAVKECYGR